MQCSSWARRSLSVSASASPYLSARCTSKCAHTSPSLTQTLLAVFRAHGTVHQCTIALDAPASRLVVTLACEHGTSHAPLLTQVCASATGSRSRTARRSFLASTPHPRTTSASARTRHASGQSSFSQVAARASARCTARRARVCFAAASTPHSKAKVRTPPPLTPVRSSIHSEVSVDVAELEQYDIQAEASVCFSLWDFRAAIHAAEMLGTSLQIEFAAGGDPLFVRFAAGGILRAEFILATTGSAHADVPRPVRRTHTDADDSRRVRPKTEPTWPDELPTMAVPSETAHVPSGVPNTASAHNTPAPDAQAAPSAPATPPTPLGPNLYIPPAPEAHATASERAADDTDSTRMPLHVLSQTLASSQAVAPTPVERGGSFDEHPSTLFNDASLSPSPRAASPEEWPATQIPAVPRKKVRPVPAPPLTPVSALVLARAPPHWPRGPQHQDSVFPQFPFSCRDGWVLSARRRSRAPRPKQPGIYAYGP